MTTERSLAYRRAMRTLRDLGPAKLWPSEQAAIRHAADDLLFCPELSGAAMDSMAAVLALVDVLVDSDRWTAERAQELLDDVWACGPELAGAAA